MKETCGDPNSMVVTLTPEEVGRLIAVAFDVLKVPPSEIDIARFIGSQMMQLVRDYEQCVGEFLCPDVPTVQAAVDTGRERLEVALLNAQLAEKE